MLSTSMAAKRTNHRKDFTQTTFGVFQKAVGEALPEPEIIKDTIEFGQLGGLKGGTARAKNWPPSSGQRLRRKRRRNGGARINDLFLQGLGNSVIIPSRNPIKLRHEVWPIVWHFHQTSASPRCLSDSCRPYPAVKCWNSFPFFSSLRASSFSTVSTPGARRR